MTIAFSMSSGGGVQRVERADGRIERITEASVSTDVSGAIGGQTHRSWRVWREGTDVHGRGMGERWVVRDVPAECAETFR